MLDDHILKAQTMHSSAYIKPFEEEMKEWEDKLISMQDILDAWLRCQESWLYLEPIFNSEDIMKQMPVEGRKFNKVDRIWRNIMAKTVSDTRVLQATSQPNMLVSEGRPELVRSCFPLVLQFLWRDANTGRADGIKFSAK